MIELVNLSLLDHVGSMLGQEVTLSQTLDGLLRIECIVDNAERKTMILSALAAVKDQHTQAVFRFRKPRHQAM